MKDMEKMERTSVTAKKNMSVKKRKKTSYLPACPCRQYLQKAAQIANEEFSLYIHVSTHGLFKEAKKCQTGNLSSVQN